jgi:hypothetical protein
MPFNPGMSFTKSISTIVMERITSMEAKRGILLSPDGVISAIIEFSLCKDTQEKRMFWYKIRFFLLNFCQLSATADDGAAFRRPMHDT